MAKGKKSGGKVAGGIGKAVAYDGASSKTMKAAKSKSYASGGKVGGGGKSPFSAAHIKTNGDA